MVELVACRRTTDPGDGHTACEKKVVAHGNTTGLMHKVGATLSAADEGSAAEGGRPLLDLLPFQEIWLVDFEFGSEPGENPEPVCLVARELRSGRKVRLRRDEFGNTPPYPTGPTALFVAYYASAEISCYLAFGWPVPERVLDLFPEFRNRTNGVPTCNGSGLLGALAYFGLDGIGTVEKDEMRARILRGGPWSDVEWAEILDYCESDVAALERLLLIMLPQIDLPRALLRGRYMIAVARMERNGVPIEMRLSDLTVGRDGRNRTMLSAFRARTGRNQPSNTKFIFGPSVWLRGLIKPPPGYGVAYIDYQQQEFGIAAALSGDPLMIEAYRSGDPYLAFAKQAGAAPPDATKATHKAIRDQFKQCVLAVQYGMGAEALAQRIGQPPIRARELLRLHRETYRVFWPWSDAAVDHAMLTGSLHTVFGWRVRVPEVPNERSLRNFPMQANDAEMLRLACCFGTERGIEVCAPVHDAVLICAPLDRLEADVARMQEAMTEASRDVLSGFELGTDTHIVRYPDRYMDERGAVMWDRVMNLIDGQLLKAA
jgi:hypothetical protein